MGPATSHCWCVFTDASYEPSPSGVKSGLGAVLVDHRGKVTRFFSAWCSSDVLKRMNATEAKTAIFECEFFAVFCAVKLWSNLLTRSNVVVYTDNNGVRDALISCRTSSQNARPILESILRLEAQSSLLTWYARVPTFSNIADSPSRGEFSGLVDQGASRDELDVAKMFGDVALSNWGS